MISFSCSCLDRAGSEADMQYAFETSCETQLNSFAVDYQEGTSVEITGSFSFVLDSVKRIDSIHKIKEISEQDELNFD